MDFIYQTGLRLYVFAVAAASLFNKKALLLYRGWKGVFGYLSAVVTYDGSGCKVVWVHCASLGEFEQGRPLIEAIKAQYPHYKILLTFFSPSGYEVRKNYPLADYICYLPADTRKNAGKFIRLTNPAMAFFIKYEYWNNYIDELNARNIPLYLVSAIFRPEQLFFRKGFRGRWFRHILAGVDHFFVQNNESARLLEGIGLKNSTVTGDTRFDRVAEIAASRRVLPLVEKFKGDSVLIVAGSSWPPDEAILASYLESNKNVKMIFAPHEVDEPNVKRLTELLPHKSVLYSKAGEDAGNYRIMVIDSIGILSGIYGYADITYIGGGFGVGIHNTLEAAIYNIPVLFGPNYLKFHEAVELVRRKVAFPVANSRELETELNHLIDNKDLLSEIEANCKAFMSENVGATQRILKSINNF